MNLYQPILVTPSRQAVSQVSFRPMRSWRFWLIDGPAKVIAVVYWGWYALAFALSTTAFLIAAAMVVAHFVFGVQFE